MSVACTVCAERPVAIKYCQMCYRCYQREAPPARAIRRDERNSRSVEAAAKQLRDKEAKAQRALEVYRAYQIIGNLRGAGEELGLTGERVRQILKVAGHPTRIPRPKLERIVKPREQWASEYEANLRQRLFSQIENSDAEGCWLWTGCSIAPAPRYPDRRFGKISVSPKWSGVKQQHDYPHRLAFRLSGGGDIPKGLWLHHLCGNTLCCNPKHLQLLSPKEALAMRRPRNSVMASEEQLDVSATASNQPEEDGLTKDSQQPQEQD